MSVSITLNTGAVMPTVGFGCWKVEQELAPEVIKQAIRTGYRHFDCAADYGNEAQVGVGIRAAIEEGLVKREDLWITSKLWNTDHGKEHVRPALERTLKDLGLSYVDLYLVHFPIALKHVPQEVRYPAGWIHDPTAADPKMEFSGVPLRETWEGMEAVMEAGLCKNIGVSNVTTSGLRELLSSAIVRPANLQVELHPYLTQEKLLKYCKAEGISVTGFSPLGSTGYVAIGMATVDDSVLATAVVRKIAEAHGKTPGQVVLRWGVQRGTAVVPKTVKEERLKENIALFDFTLSEEEMSAVSGLNQNRRFNDPGDFAEKAFNTFCPIYD